jgi:glucan phosphoethanolaminetransferase (alkaline phosphatase superfamily)
VDNDSDLYRRCTSIKPSYQQFINLTYAHVSLYAFLFGMLMEYRGLSPVIKGDIRLQSTLLVVTAVLMVFVFIPVTSWIAWFSLDHPLYLEVLIILETHMILAVLAGTLFVRSFTKESRPV